MGNEKSISNIITNNLIDSISNSLLNNELVLKNKLIDSVKKAFEEYGSELCDELTRVHQNDSDFKI